MRTDDFSYDLPPERIAQTPAEPRDSSRLMVLSRADQSITNVPAFRDIVDYLRAGDVLVANQSKVIPARIFGHKEKTGGSIELLVLRRLPSSDDDPREVWEALVKPGRGLRTGARLVLGDDAEKLGAEVVGETESGRAIRFDTPPLPFLDRYGQMPLPPYIHAKPADSGRYQTVYADPTRQGSAAAPTAGLHFTPDLLARLAAMGVGFERVTLHVGLDTFQPVKEDDPLTHKMHSEWCEMDADVARRLNQTRATGGRIIAVGTTAARTLESAFVYDAAALNVPTLDGSPDADSDAPPATAPGHFAAFTGPTTLFIYPGRPVGSIDGLITNFHLPRSTLLLLVSALAGRRFILRAYDEAIREGYRFYSFGDAMLIL